MHCQAHPSRPIICSCTHAGAVYVWSKNYTENWAAFAPDFEELGENTEYIEREDEFDYIEDINARPLMTMAAGRAIAFRSITEDDIDIVGVSPVIRSFIHRVETPERLSRLII
jgi:hypothetical protein